MQYIKIEFPEEEKKTIDLIRDNKLIVNLTARLMEQIKCTKLVYLLKKFCTYHILADLILAFIVVDEKMLQIY